MRLKSLKLAGFKSFANPTTFHFPHGITAIVGPNGCGKSNVIDAIRWVLGESSAKQLRGGAMSDVIFAGTQDKSAKSLASVELTFEHTGDEQTGIRHELNVYHELTVRRQVTRDGKSDYYINGTRCRRRDVIDVFLGTGLGSRSYSVIGQGMIGRIVDATPFELRSFIEEGAGVSRYQARRSETHKKLTAARDNLHRLQDTQNELQRQQQGLEKQAKRAFLYHKLKSQQRRVVYALALLQVQLAEANHTHKAQEHTTLQTQFDQKQQDLIQLSKQLASTQDKAAQLTWLVDDAKEKRHASDLTRQTAQHALTSHEQHASELTERIHRTRIKHAHTQKSAQGEQDKIAHYEATLQKLGPQLDAMQQGQHHAQAQLSKLQTARQTKQETVQTLSRQQNQLDQKIALNKQALMQWQTELERYKQAQQAWQQEWAKLGIRLANELKDGQGHKQSNASSHNLTQTQSSPKPPNSPLLQELDELTQRLTSIDTQLDTLDEELSDALPQLDRLTQQVDETQTALGALEKQHATQLSEYDTLHRLQNQSPKQAQAKKPGSQSQPSLSAQSMSFTNLIDRLPTLNDTLTLSEAGKPYAELLGNVLSVLQSAHVGEASLIDNVIQQSPQADDTTDQTHTLRGMLSLVTETTVDSDDSNRMNLKHMASLNALLPKTLQDTLIPLSELLDAPKLALLRRCFLIKTNVTDVEIDLQTFATYRQAFAQLGQPNVCLITQTGWLMGDFGAVHSSLFVENALDAGQAGQRLAQKVANQARLAQLDDVLNDVDTRIKAKKNTLHLVTQTLHAHRIHTQELQAKHKTLTQQQHRLSQRNIEITSLITAQRQQQEQDKQRLMAQKIKLDDDEQQLNERQKQLVVVQTKLSEQSQGLAPKLKAAQAELASIEQATEHWQNQRSESQNDWQALKLKHQQILLAHRHAKDALKTLSEDDARLGEQLTKLKQTLSQLKSKTAGLKQTVNTAQQTHHQLDIRLQERMAELTAAQQQYADIKSKHHVLGDAVQTLQNKLSEKTASLAVTQERLAQAKEQLNKQKLTQTASAEPDKSQSNDIATHKLDAFINKLMSDSDTHQSSCMDLAPFKSRQALAARIQQLKEKDQSLTRQIDAMGAVNLTASEELNSINERLGPLTQHINDITASIATLTDAIATIDAKTKTLFLQTLDAVNRELDGLFKKVFGGGQASLTLVQDANLRQSDAWQAGLELMAQPKGKKNTRLAVLSGGEKTLTALSLIFAIFRQHPAPFCLLDEVDAPLDDANVARFTSLIKELAGGVQFIFISHNKLAMQIADELKGITMPTAGISALVSVDLSEAMRYVDAEA